MNSDDRNLGMDSPISRRDLLHGAGARVGSTIRPAQNKDCRLIFASYGF